MFTANGCGSSCQICFARNVGLRKYSGAPSLNFCVTLYSEGDRTALRMSVFGFPKRFSSCSKVWGGSRSWRVDIFTQHCVLQPVPPPGSVACTFAGSSYCAVAPTL